jgi:molybdopterin converting factor small subunit
MARLRLPRSLVALFPDSPRELEIHEADLVSLIRALDVRYPGMWDRLCEPGPRLREHINVFVDGHRVTIDAPLSEVSIVHIIPAVSGGAETPRPPNARGCRRSAGGWSGGLAGR